jgi:hypothetical protein
MRVVILRVQDQAMVPLADVWSPVLTTGSSNGTSWWVPVLVAAAAAFASYFATWVMKRRDVERELAGRCAELLNEAADTARLGDYAYADAGGAETVKAALTAARSAVYPLRDSDLDYRLLAAERFTFETTGWTIPRVWLGEAIENARHGLVGYLAPPRFAPWRRGARRARRTFPTYGAYEEAQVEAPYGILDWLGEWMSHYEKRTRWGRWPRVKRRIRRLLGRGHSPYEPE